MLKYPEISPIIFQIGPLALRWYGVMYAFSFFGLITIMRRQSMDGFLPLSERMVERLFIYLVICILAGARIFYILFYGNILSGPNSIVANPLEALALWHGGMSFHGGFAGILLASYLVSRQAKVPWVSVMDIFPGGGPYPRHPSQLYESLLEGLVLGVILWTLKGRVKRHGVIAACFMLGYAFFRTTAEFFREPDVQLGFVLGPFTMGQLLSIGVLIPGILFLRYSLKHGPLITRTKKNKGSS